jgi:hypothetical protein
MDAGATIVPPVNLDRRGKLVIGSKRIRAAQAISNVRWPRRLSLSTTALNLITVYHPEGNDKSDTNSSQDQIR